MKRELNRRDFMRTTAAATGGIAFSQLGMARSYITEEKPLRIGFVGWRGLDTGCVYGYALSALILPRRKVVRVKARKTYCPVRR